MGALGAIHVICTPFQALRATLLRSTHPLTGSTVVFFLYGVASFLSTSPPPIEFPMARHLPSQGLPPYESPRSPKQWSPERLMEVFGIAWKSSTYFMLSIILLIHYHHTVTRPCGYFWRRFCITFLVFYPIGFNRDGHRTYSSKERRRFLLRGIF